jgi:hypothetical protein
MSVIVPCIVCDKQLCNVFEDAENQPYGGTAFQSHGHYGSTAFDPMDGQYLEVTICDECLAAKVGSVLMGRDRRLVVSEGSVVGFEYVSRPLLPWNPEVTGLDREDVVKLDPEEVGSAELTYTAEGRQRIVWNYRPMKP